MAHSKREIKPGRAHTKVDGDDTMLRTGFVGGTPLEGGKVADSQPVDLFAASPTPTPTPTRTTRSSRKQRASADDEGRTTTTNNEKNVVIAESEPVDLAATNPAAATTEQPGRRGQGVDEHTGAGGRRLGLGRPGPA